MVEVIGGYEVHPVASLFPLMGDTELRELAEDIRANGQWEPVKVAAKSESDDSLVLIDGRNRLSACELLGVAPAVELMPFMFADDEVFGPMIVGWNLHRRHLGTGQRAAIAAEYEGVYAVAAKNRQRMGKESLPYPENAGQASDHVGSLMGVSGRSVRDAKFVMKHEPEAHKKVKNGEASPSGEARRIRNRNAPTPPKGNGELNQKGHGNAKKQLRATENMRHMMSGVATGLEASFDGGFERTFTPEAAGVFARDMRRELARIESVLRSVEQHANS